MQRGRTRGSKWRSSCMLRAWPKLPSVVRRAAVTPRGQVACRHCPCRLGTRSRPDVPHEGPPCPWPESQPASSPQCKGRRHLGCDDRRRALSFRPCHAGGSRQRAFRQWHDICVQLHQRQPHFQGSRVLVHRASSSAVHPWCGPGRMAIAGDGPGIVIEAPRSSCAAMGDALPGCASHGSCHPSKRPGHPHRRRVVALQAKGAAGRDESRRGPATIKNSLHGRCTHEPQRPRCAAC